VAISCPEGALAEAARLSGLTVFAPPARSMELRRSLRDRAGHAARLAIHGREAAALARDLDARVVVAWGARSLLALTSALARHHPPLIFAHNDVLAGPAIAAAVRAGARRAAETIALSHTVAEDLDPAGVLDVHVIQPGVDLNAFSPAEPANPPYALTLGAIEPWKRPDLALETIAHLPDLRLVVAGAPIGSEGERLYQRMRERATEPDLNGRVDLVGQLDDPRATLQGATVLLHCAPREPFGIALIEALASGVPIVAPARGGPTEIVTKDCGRLYPPGDTEAAARGIEEAAPLRAHARERAQHFDVQATRDHWAAALQARRARVPRPAAGALTAVTVTHNSAADLERLVLSRDAHLPEANLIVVDAGSSDESAAAARRAGATVIELDNVGYGAAANAGVAESKTEVTIVLNPDIELIDDSLDALADEAARHKDRILVPLTLRPDGGRQDIAHRGPAGWSDLAIALGPPAAIPEPLRTRIQPWRANVPTRVDWPVAACLAARTETLRRLGPFDPEIFLYAEDMDLGLRAREAGIETWFWPAARVVHHQSHSTEQAFGGEPFERLARQRHAVVERRRGPATARRDDLLQALTFTNRAAIKRLLGHPADRERAQLAALRNTRRGAAR
jgi:N-acetylglucosaminyl-diphospho-decaprenol L-rhamnosyltransferase